jgi:hypothetical protein
MDSKEKQLFTLMWALLKKYQALLGESLPVFHEVVTTLGGGKTPTPEQLHAWEQGYLTFDQKLHEVTANLEALRPIADPLFGYDT